MDGTAEWQIKNQNKQNSYAKSWLLCPRWLPPCCLQLCETVTYRWKSPLFLKSFETTARRVLPSPLPAPFRAHAHTLSYSARPQRTEPWNQQVATNTAIDLISPLLHLCQKRSLIKNKWENSDFKEREKWRTNTKIINTNSSLSKNISVCPIYRLLLLLLLLCLLLEMSYFMPMTSQSSWNKWK